MSMVAFLKLQLEYRVQNPHNNISGQKPGRYTNLQTIIPTIPQPYMNRAFDDVDDSFEAMKKCFISTHTRIHNCIYNCGEIVELWAK